jgi:protein phosphatase PTC7
MGTDGLFDNVYDEEMEPCIKEQLSLSDNLFVMKDPTAAAKCIGDLAYGKSKNTRYESPFAKGAKLAGKWYTGGKEDDITVIVSHIVTA